MNTRSFYRDHLLSCAPLPLPDGRYQARVSITSLGGDQTRSQRFIDLEACATEAAAIDRARTSGMDWIDVNVPGAPTPEARS
jgi:hypothetical protein